MVGPVEAPRLCRALRRPRAARDPITATPPFDSDAHRSVEARPATPGAGQRVGFGLGLQMTLFADVLRRAEVLQRAGHAGFEDGFIGTSAGSVRAAAEMDVDCPASQQQQ
ncbi:hypothetical protein ONZ51_g11277 [Trametes cubensis]|uniref:Uncharacterized protein n=1 Tax=Trametes cubensis TaxID=1111947 RepID=A0AAD7X474_9APHY|nr:hypothetical protein ONZ51_g11277 [Trametes cubensis]